MTGEMGYIDNKTGIDSNGECWPIHLAIAQACNGELKPFDSYQGPYIVVGTDVVAQPESDYRIPIQGFGIVRLWLWYENEIDLVIYREDTQQSVRCWDDPESAIEAAKELLTNE